MNAPILVATDGTPGAAGALRMARTLARRDGRPVTVLAALQPVTLTGSAAYPLLAGEARLEEAQLDLLRGSVEAQVREVCGAACDWSIEIEIGSPPMSIVRRAAEVQAGLIVMGLGRHTAADRWLGTETVLKVIQLSHVPVLAAHQNAEGLPGRCVVATDFSEFSRDAARLTGDLLGTGVEVHLAHVEVTLADRSSAGGREWQETYRAGARARLDSLRTELTARAPSRVFTTLLDGEPSRALLRFATMTGAELIVCGSHGYGFFARMISGSVSTRLIRGAGCSVLVNPPQSAVTEFLSAPTPAVEQASPPASIA
jgi:nucleotide-binding universal stress UspA family protein